MKKIGIVGLGYVGLPLAVEFARKYPTFGFDINEERVQELNEGRDRTCEVDEEVLREVIVDKVPIKKGLWNTSHIEELAGCNFYIVTVPTPTDVYHRPVLAPLQKASESIATIIKKGDIVIYESTVYPGVTEEICVPILEMNSGLTFNKDFYVGYSPERINPGDKEHTVTKILKVTSGSTPEIAEVVDGLYKEIITAGTYRASCIKVAEAAKVIENSQRDINIAFVNELSKIFNKLQIDTLEVLEAAGTKWNFLPFRPGLVGGHCIGVDPYYLAQKAQEVGYHPEIILAGRRLNDSMGSYVASECVKLMINKEMKIKGSKLLILGFTFKENCPDIRNTQVIDLYRECIEYGLNVEVYDPWADEEEVRKEYGIQLVRTLEKNAYDGVILTVSHRYFMDMNVSEYTKETSVLYDVKSVLPVSIVDGRL